MKKLILKRDSDFETGRVIDRPNRFILNVDFESSTKEVYLANSGALSTVISPDRKVLCEYAVGPNRKTDYDAFAIKVDDIYVTVKSTFANEIFSKILEKNILNLFKNYKLKSREPSLPDHGRADFLLKKGKKKNISK